MTASRWILTAGFALLLVVGVRFRRRVKETMRRYLTDEVSALSLAIFRIVLFGMLLALPPATVAAAQMSPSLLVPPPGWGPVIHLVPLDVTVARVAVALVMGASFTAMIGFYTRSSAAVVALVGVYAYGLPQFFGKISHGHHILWFAALLAVSPSGYALSIDGWRAGRPLFPGGRSAAFGFPLRVAGVLVGLIYLFPGLWKIWRGGFGWGSATNMRNHLHQKWFEDRSVNPPFRLDEYDALLTLGGMGVLIFEVGFLFALFHPIARPLWVGAGVLFHVSNYLFLRILFLPLLLCYVIFADWDRWLPRSLFSAAATHPPPRGPSRSACLLAAGLVAATGFVGVASIESWPFAVYPAFSSLPSSTVERVRLELWDENGDIAFDTDAAIRGTVGSIRWAAISRRLLRERDPTALGKVARGLWEEVRNRHPELAGVRGLRLRAMVHDVRPDDPDPPLEGRVLWSGGL